MRTVYAMDQNQMSDWKEICRTFCKQFNVKLLFVNETSLGVELKDGSMRHIYIDELVEILGRGYL